MNYGENDNDSNQKIDHHIDETWIDPHVDVDTNILNKRNYFCRLGQRM